MKESIIMSREKSLEAKLRDCASSGDVDGVNHYLSLGANINSMDSYLNAPLHLAANYGHVDVVRALLAHPNVKIDLQGWGKSTPLHFAGLANKIDVARILIDKNRDLLLCRDRNREFPDQVARGETREYLVHQRVQHYDKLKQDHEREQLRREREKLRRPPMPFIYMPLPKL
jgi:ankyrin repeat protein